MFFVCWVYAWKLESCNMFHITHNLVFTHSPLLAMIILDLLCVFCGLAHSSHVHEKFICLASRLSQEIRDILV